jgi:hypothetical protein
MRVVKGTQETLELPSLTHSSAEDGDAVIEMQQYCR